MREVSNTSRNTEYIMGSIRLKGVRAFAFYGGIVGFIGAALYPIVIYPYFHVDEYKEVQKINRAGIDQEAIQPGGMKVWTDPFDRRK
ncbi:small integral membrane protein 20-like [Stegodyphus dumicola]|uniref:small integral membrane protein 20-like n=1 Tax=Stegodyphus dumicola TaxID=202533 RepID=UPI0015AC9BF2|nr:small integral membrane protein 20-like [Stegodyphus dumicola]